MFSESREYQFVNPTTQVALFSLCIGNCSSILQKIIWNLYSGEANSSLWILFNQTQNYFFGKRSSNFTVTNQLFIQNPTIQFWKFEVVYSFPNQTSTSALHFVLNQPTLKMVLVQFLHRMEQQQLYFWFLVQTGLMKMELKIILFILSQINLWSLFQVNRRLKFIYLQEKIKF